MVLKFLCFFYIFQIEYMESRQSRVNDFEMQLQALRVQDAEEYNMVKIKLETDVQVCWERILHQSSHLISQKYHFKGIMLTELYFITF